MDADEDLAGLGDMAGWPVGRIFSDGVERYLLEATSSTGFVAWKLADGTILVSESAEVSLKASPSVEFWACAGYQDTSLAGEVTAFDCHGCGITRLDVASLTKLESLDCGFNRLAELNVAGLRWLKVLDVEGNQLTSLGVGDLLSLQVLNCAHNQLTTLDLTGASALQVVDCSYNEIASIHFAGCPLLSDITTEGNPIKLVRQRD